jgi:hypothetical protein
MRPVPPRISPQREVEGAGRKEAECGFTGGPRNTRHELVRAPLVRTSEVALDMHLGRAYVPRCPTPEQFTARCGPMCRTRFRFLGG